MKKIYKSLIISSSLLPLFVFAATFDTALTNVQNIVGKLIPIFTTIAFIVFIWGIVQFISAAGDEEKRANGRQLMIWGVVGIAVIVGVWGLAKLLLGVFGVTGVGETITPPTVQF